MAKAWVPRNVKEIPADEKDWAAAEDNVSPDIMEALGYVLEEREPVSFEAEAVASHAILLSYTVPPAVSGDVGSAEMTAQLMGEIRHDSLVPGKRYRITEVEE